MAKRPKAKGFSFQGWDVRAFRQTEQYVRAVETLMDSATLDVAESVSCQDVDPDKPFSFDDYPRAKARLQSIVDNLASRMQAVITSGTRKQWLFACAKNDAFISSIMDTSKVSKARLKKMQDRNLDALKAFQGRKVRGMDLSKRVWNYVDQYKEQLECAIDAGIGDGKSAQQLSRDVRNFLKYPDKLFRRVRDKHGNLVLSKAARAFHPGQGVYRSSYKNAMRLTRSEVNMAYRESDWERWQQLDFVVGFEVHRSNHEPEYDCPICERLKGRYPKTFKFTGWHPQCRCFVTAILMDDETFDKNELGDLKAALRGVTYKPLQAKNGVSEMPDGFTSWVEENAERVKGWKNTPYFIRDNFRNGNIDDGLKTSIMEELDAAPKVDPRDAQIQAMQPQIDNAVAICNSWGWDIADLQAAINAKDVSAIQKFINTTTKDDSYWQNNLNEWAKRANDAISKAEALKVRCSDLKKAVAQVLADKSTWMSVPTRRIGEHMIDELLDAIRDAADRRRRRSKKPIDVPHSAMQTDYKSPSEVVTTMRAINKETGWFEHGVGDLLVETDPKNNGSTAYWNGKIWLRPERLRDVQSAMAKIGQGKSSDITFDEADAMATYWHEITHNRQKPGYIRITPMERKAMELANEFVARHTLPEFYGKLGCGSVPHPEFITNRASTGYNRMVTNYDHIIKQCGLDEAKVLDAVRDNLFNVGYDKQFEGLRNGLKAGGIKRLDGKKLSDADINKLLRACRDYYKSDMETVMRNIGVLK